MVRVITCESIEDHFRWQHIYPLLVPDVAVVLGEQPTPSLVFCQRDSPSTAVHLTGGGAVGYGR